MAASAKIYGLRECQAAFRKYDKELAVEMIAELKIVAEPVRRDSTVLAISGIRNIGGRWAQMRTGATGSSVYVAPKARRRGGSPRPNLAPLLMDKGMQPALDQNTDEVYRALDVMLGRLGAANGF